MKLLGKHLELEISSQSVFSDTTTSKQYTHARVSSRYHKSEASIDQCSLDVCIIPYT